MIKPLKLQLSFFKKSGLIVDGMVGENTFLQLMLAENPNDNDSLVTTSSAEDIVIDDKPPSLG